MSDLMPTYPEPKHRAPQQSDHELLAETLDILRRWHDHQHSLTFMDVCPYEPCRLLPTTVTRYPNC